MTKGGLLLLAVFAGAIMGSQAFNFPYVQCTKRPSAYSLAPASRTPDNSTLCFTVKVAIPADCNTYCCRQADLRKIVIDIHPECNVKNPSVSATVNGVPTRVGAGFEPGLNGPADAYVLRLTQLGLNLTNADGVEICVTTGTNTNGVGCATIEALCKPPSGAPAGTCSAALFDSRNDCCPIGHVPEYTVPPSPAQPLPLLPPAEPLAPLLPAVRPCTACVTLSLRQVMDTWYTVSFSEEQCAAWVNMVITDVTAQAAEVNVTLVQEPPVVTCTNDMMQVCGRFATEEDAALLQDWISTQIYFWYSKAVDTCKAYYRGPYKVTAEVNNGVDNTGCLNAYGAVACDPPPIDFPKCKCDTRPGATPFYATPYLDQFPGRTNTTTLYCFNVVVRDAVELESTCGNTTTLHKAEIYADDTLRRKVKGLAVQPAGASALRYMATSWGTTGDDTLKFTSLNWGLREANGSRLCMEVESSLPIGDLCFSGSPENCMINFFDPTRDCCPLFPAST